MPGLLQSMLACAAVLVSTLPLHAQSNSRLRPGTDSSVTTGIGTSGTFRNVPPPSDQPPPDTSRKFFWDTPESVEAFAPKVEGNEIGGARSETGKAAVAPPAPDVPEDPRTMITRDRIESPQH